MQSKKKVGRKSKVKLSEILNSVASIQVTGRPEAKEIEKITLDSRDVSQNTLFFAIKGFKTDGHNFILDAINKGAVAIVLEDNTIIPDDVFKVNDVVKILVKDSRKTLSYIAAIFNGNPSERMQIVGITGTKGKTTTAFYIKHLFDTVFGKSGLIGTIANYVGNEKVKSKLTTPQADEINAFLKEMVNEGIKHCAMEVSSHALSLSRVDHIKFAAGIFMNLTSDHMDYHQTKEHYLASKKILFDVLSENAYAIYNADDENSQEMIKDTEAKKLSFGKNENADIRISNIEYDIDGTKFTLSFMGKNYKAETSLAGEFNAYNAAAAFAVGIALDIVPEVIIRAISTTPQVPGRMEVIKKDDKYVVIDYSHTSDSLSQALNALIHIVKGQRQIFTVFGCGGDRDKTKRPVMGGIATDLSDYAILTSDNPRTENPFDIIKDVEAGIKKKNYKVLENREEAIKEAIKSTPKNAVILIAGKGHEDYQEIMGVRSHFSDREMAEKYLNE